MKETQLQIIIAEAKKGKNAAQNTLIERFWSSIYHYVNGKIKDENESEDIAIETFTKVFTKLRLYNPDFDFRTWVLSIAHNTMIDHIRKSPGLRISLDDETNTIEIAEDLPTPEESLIQQQDKDAFEKYIHNLKPEYRKIIELRYLDDKTYKEIAEELKLSMPNVKVRLLRAKQLLQEILKG